jgi:hypothetical protein
MVWYGMVWCMIGATSDSETGGFKCICPEGKVQASTIDVLNVECAACPVGGVCMSLFPPFPLSSFNQVRIQYR